MARQINEESRLSKLNEILDCAQGLIYSAGYEQMSIQDICLQLGISKGAFYHYFDSKPALLEALLDRMSQQALEIIFPILEDPNLTAPEKLERFYEKTNNWKSTQKQYLLAVLKAWYMDENAIVRQKTLTYFGAIFSSALERVFLQGVEEDVFYPAYPHLVGNVVYSLMVQMSDSIGYILLSAMTSPEEAEEKIMHRLKELINAYTDAIERVLGAKPGTIHLMDEKMLKEWLPENITPETFVPQALSVEKE